MPHQCVRCSKVHPDGSQAILKGCECGGRFFFFVKKKHLNQAKKISEKLSTDDKKKIQQDVSSMIGMEDEDSPVVLDFESIRIQKPGKYELDLVDLFKSKPLVYKLADGKYIIDLASTFEQED
tara:strand:+ start:214 stop:582 length:369 start_codon:yes stop_codon:yes gene_type:complete